MENRDFIMSNGERIAISKVVLKYMFESQSLIFVTTHDLSIVDAFSNISQYCFNDDIVDKIWKSDYKIKAGVCKVGNAIKLLEVYGFDSKIVEQLKKPYQAFSCGNMFSKTSDS